MTGSEALATCRAIVQRRLDQAEAERAFHRARGPRLGNIEATVAALKAAWARGVLAEMDAVAAKVSR